MRFLYSIVRIYMYNNNVFLGAGDTLYFKFTSESGEGQWAYKFNVSGGKAGRFDTGHSILSAVLGIPHSLRYNYRPNNQ